MKIKKSVVLLSLIMLVSLFFMSSVFASPLAETYWFTNLGIGGASTIDSELDHMGYNGHIYCDTSATYVRRTMDDDAVFAYVGHGLPGILNCNSSDYYLSAYNITSDTYNRSLQYAFANTSDKLSSIRFAYYGACYSNVYSSTYGRLTSYTTSNLDALAAMGFNDSIYNSVATYFEKRLFIYLDNGNTISASREYAAQDSISQFGLSTWNNSQVDTCSITGNQYVKLEPAAYGN
ncbi:MAG: hypothetical protein ACOWWH_13785 [Eubacteriaceae bacterium]